MAIVYPQSTLTNEEFYRLYGHLTPERIESLLDIASEDRSADIEGALIHIREAKAGFPGEDFLSGVVSDLHKALDKVRGAHIKELLWKAIRNLEDIEQQTASSEEHGREELYKAEECLTKSSTIVQY